MVCLYEHFLQFGGGLYILTNLSRLRHKVELPVILSDNKIRLEKIYFDPQYTVTLFYNKNISFCCTGVDNPGHPFIMTVGMVAGDEDSYTDFAELFDPVIDGRHNGYGKVGTLC